MKELIKVWCEWDIGLNDKVFTSEDAAKQAAIDGLIDAGSDESFDELFDGGLIGFDTVNVITK